MLETQFRRFTAKTHITESGCIEWTAARDRNGYPQLTLSGKSKYAHVVAYEHWVGPVPDGHEVDHLCRNRGCVNPTHLEAVTEFINKSRRYRPDPTKCGAGQHDWIPENWYTSGHGTKYCKPCAKAKAKAAYRRRRDA